MAHIDVRGPWPVYISGMVAVVLEGYSRKTSTEQFELDRMARLDMDAIEAEIAEFIPENEGK